MATTGYALSLIVNALVTGLIVFRILKVFLEVETTMTSVERTLGSTGGTKLRHIIFVIIESGMALFVIQLIRVIVSSNANAPVASEIRWNIFYIVDLINDMLNVIIGSFEFFFCFTDNIFLSRASHQQ